MSDRPPRPDAPGDAFCGGDPLARALARLAPAPSGLATPEFLFAAGRAAEAGRTALWRRLCLGQAGLSCVGAALVAVWATGPALPTGEDASRSVGTAQPAAVAPAPDAELAPAPREVSDAPVSQPEPAGFAVKPTGDEPTLDERVRWLRLRNDVLAAGLTLLPEAAAPRRPAGFDALPSPAGGVYAVPPAPERPAPKENEGGQ